MKGYKITKVGGVFLTNGSTNPSLEVGKKFDCSSTVENHRIHGPGYHFCRYIWDTMMYGNPRDYEVWQIVSDEDAIGSSNRLCYVTKSFKVIRKLTTDEVIRRIANLDDDIILGEPPELKRKALLYKFWATTLSGDPDPEIRELVAGLGNYPYVLSYDKDPKVRAAVARAGGCLDRLLNDPDWRVRYEICKLGYGLEVLSEDSHPEIQALARKQMAKSEMFEN